MREAAMTTTITPGPLATAPGPPLYRLSVAQYHAMAEAGILAEDEPVELIEGILVQKMTKSRPHALAVLRLIDVLPPLLPAAWHLETEQAITLEDSEPEPDAAVIRGRADDYLAEHPPARAVGLIVEVAKRSLADARNDRKRAYARAGIPVYWILVVEQRRIEVYTDPTGPTGEPTYREERHFAAGESVLLVLDGIPLAEVAVSDLLRQLD
jgi:Uma2 family endonuclease